MQGLFDHPAVQAGLIPLIASLIVATVLARTRFGWLGVVAGYAAMVAVTTGFSISPLSAGRKVMLLVLLAPLAGVARDLMGASAARLATMLSGPIAALAAIWAFSSVLGQRDAGDALVYGTGVVLFTAVLVWSMTRMADDGPAAGAAGVGLGLAAGLSALLSASTGYFMAGIAVAAASGALQLTQLVARRSIPPGATGVLSIGVAAALFSGATLLLAQLPWYALPLLLLPVVLPVLPILRDAATAARVVVLTLAAIAGAAAPVFAAWLAATSGAG